MAWFSRVYSFFNFSFKLFFNPIFRFSLVFFFRLFILELSFKKYIFLQVYIQVGLSIWAKAPRSRGGSADQKISAHLQVGLAGRGILNADGFVDYPQTF